MCFIIKQTSTIETLLKRFKLKKDIQKKLDFSQAEELSGFIAKKETEGFKVRVVTNDCPEDIQVFRWGLIPSKKKNMFIEPWDLNATIEKLDSHPAYAESANNRCLILVDGFYEHEWLDEKGTKKQFHLVESSDGKPLAFAGIYREAVAPNGEVVRSCAIVTTKARGIMEQIHNSKLRMPLILKLGQEREWLRADLNTFRSEIDNKVNTNLVSRKIEKPKKTDKPNDKPVQGSLFDF